MTNVIGSIESRNSARLGVVWSNTGRVVFGQVWEQVCTVVRRGVLS